jgi:Flp pilus assembly protein TadG/predicted Fe-Mo cluster-binding NifX family protein
MFIKLINRFLADKRGNFPIMAVIAFPVIFGSVAFSVDIMNNLRMRTELQNANDTAVLYATRSFQETKAVPSTILVEKFIKANFNGPLQNVKVSFDKTKNEMKLTSQSAQTPYMMNYFGNHSSVLNVESRATLGVAGILEFSLALDTTESMMYDGRMDGLKVAAKNFVQLLFDVKDRGADVKGAIVPFSRYVNVGVSRRNEAWMDVPADVDTRKTVEKEKKETPIIGWKDCVTKTYPAQTINHPATNGWTENRDGVIIQHAGTAAWTEYKQAGSWQDCKPIYGPEKTVKWTETSGKLYTWNGCVGSREYPYNVQEDYGNRKFPGLMDVSCADELQPLTGIRGQLISTIAKLKPSDNTYIPEGIMWGTRTLTHSMPFSEAKAPDPSASAVTKDRKALVIMTDGDNTLSPNLASEGGNNNMSPNTAWHKGTNVALANQYTLAACNEAKSKGIEVYTISFGTSVSAAVKDLLEQCASKSDFSFQASNAAALNTAFKDIADQLLSVRLSQ